MAARIISTGISPSPVQRVMEIHVGHLAGIHQLLVQ